ncbi:MAG TPA: GntR family transcriptional regulator, partial [Candidatus Paceibacterota bacterium]|nr:GntR family transcriptional regulator [Candidatus Paceibacterota bacterium]
MVTNKKVKVYESLRQRIIGGELKPGLPINEAVFARELSVSKTPVREALRQLERDGFVENVPG